MSCPPTAAACISPARATAALSDQNTISPSMEVSPIRAAARRTATSGDRHPAMMSGRNVRGYPADAVRVEHVHRPQQGPGARGQLVQVSAGGERHARPAVGQHPLPEEPRLAHPGRGDDRGLVLLRGEHPLEVLRPAQPPGVPGHRADQPRPEPQVRADPPAVHHRGQPGPAERQLPERGEPRRGLAPEPDPPPRPPRRQRGEQRGPREHRHGEHQDHQDEEPHRCASSSSCRAASIASEIASAARIAAA